MRREPTSALTIAEGASAQGANASRTAAPLSRSAWSRPAQALHKPACVSDEGPAGEVCEGPPCLDVTGPAWRCLRRVDSHRPGRWTDSGATSGSVISLFLNLSVKMVSY